MKISQLITLIILVVLLFVLGGIYLGSRYLILDEFDGLERESMGRSLASLQQVYHNELDQLNLINRDWAEWDDTYNYMLKKDSSHSFDNLKLTNFSTLRVSIIALYDLDNHFYGGSALEGDKVTQLSQTQKNILNTYMEKSFTGLANSGLLAIGDTTYLVSRMQILNSEAKGSPRGFLLMLRPFDNLLANKFQRSVSNNAVFYHSDELKNHGLLVELEENPRRIFPEGDSIIGQELMRTVDGRPALIFQVTHPREFSIQGQKMVEKMFLYLILGGIIYALIVLLTLNNLVSNRLTRLNDDLNKIGDDEHSLDRVTVDARPDEISHVARSCNSMLNRLEQLKKHQELSQYRQRRQSDALISLAKSDLLMQGDLELAAQRINEAICEGTEATRSSIWYCSEDQQQMYCKDLYYSATKHHQSGLSLPYYMLKGRYESASKKTSEIWSISDSYEKSRFSAMLERLGLDALDGLVLVSPIQHEEKLFGFIIIEVATPDQLWNQDEEIFILAISDYSAQTLTTLHRLSQHNKLEKLASYDQLTGLPNRTHLQKLLRIQLQRAELLDEILAILFVGVDNLQQINERLGHAAGDQVVNCIAARMQRCLRSSDQLGRLGGGEFMLFLATPRNTEDAERVAQKLLEAIQEPIECAEETLELNAVIGIALFPQHNTSLEGLIDCADSAMRQLRRSGHKGYQLYQGL